MGRKRKSALSEEKRNVIAQLLDIYEIKTAADVQEALKDLLGGTLQSMLEAELDQQIEEQEEADPEYNDSRNGYKRKTLRSSLGEIPIQVPQDRNSDFDPKIVPKYKKDISQIEGKIIGMYARGLSVAQISAQIEDIYGFEVSEGMVTAITNKLLPEIEMWQKRPLSAVYPIVYVDGIVFNVRENNVIRKATAYVVLGLNEEGRKEILSITIGESESAKFWLSVLNELKNRGVQDIFILCSDGLNGLKEAIAAAYPQAEHQRCIVHMVRNTLKYVADKDKKAFANDLKTIYHAPDEQTALARLDEIKAKWEAKYPGCMNRWYDNWGSISPMFKFSQAARQIMYTTNAIESVNSGFRRLNRGRTVFPNAMALNKALYLATWELTKKWTLPVRNWGQVYAELDIMYPGRLTKN
jgi:transposase-like protein